jgi:hypothetical protein
MLDSVKFTNEATRVTFTAGINGLFNLRVYGGVIQRLFWGQEVY